VGRLEGEAAVRRTQHAGVVSGLQKQLAEAKDDGERYRGRAKDLEAQLASQVG
jgi:hypothetical protein